MMIINASWGLLGCGVLFWAHLSLNHAHQCLDLFHPQAIRIFGGTGGRSVWLFVTFLVWKDGRLDFWRRKAVLTATHSVREVQIQCEWEHCQKISAAKEIHCIREIRSQLSLTAASLFWLIYVLQSRGNRQRRSCCCETIRYTSYEEYIYMFIKPSLIDLFWCVDPLPLSGPSHHHYSFPCVWPEIQLCVTLLYP